MHASLVVEYHRVGLNSLTRELVNKSVSSILASLCVRPSEPWRYHLVDVRVHITMESAPSIRKVSSYKLELRNPHFKPKRKSTSKQIILETIKTMKLLAYILSLAAISATGVVASPVAHPAIRALVRMLSNLPQPLVIEGKFNKSL